MKSPQATIRFASVLLFVILAMNFMTAQSLRPGSDGDVRPTGHVQGAAAEKLPAAAKGGAVVQGNGINYHTGGTVLKANPVPIYIIWYGNWTTGAKPSDSLATRTLIEGFLSSSALGGSSYEAINTTYGDTTGNVSGHLNFSGSVLDNYSQGTRFGDKNLTTIVSTHAGHDLPLDPNGVYMVLTSSDVKESSGFCRHLLRFPYTRHHWRRGHQVRLCRQR